MSHEILFLVFHSLPQSFSYEKDSILNTFTARRRVKTAVTSRDLHEGLFWVILLGASGSFSGVLLLILSKLKMGIAK
jgi:hypothetical protein